MVIWPFRRNRADAATSGAETVRQQDAPSGSDSLWNRFQRLPLAVRLLALILLVLLLWYGVLGGIRAGVSPDLALRPTGEQLPVGGSATIGYAARIVDREVNERTFTPNDPIFYPTGLARRSQAFQRNAIGTVSVVVSALAEGTSDTHLATAAERLAVPTDRWWLQAGWPPVVVPAESRLRAGIAELVAHNELVATAPRETTSTASGISPAGRRALAALILLVDAQAVRGENMISGVESGSVQEQLAAARGTSYATALLLRGIRDDNAPAVRVSGHAAQWGRALDALERAAGVSPLLPGSSDLVNVGYSLLLAGNAMRTILEGNA